MIVRLGDRRRFAIEIGEPLAGNRQLRQVDLWAAGQWLTCDDNLAYVPQFARSLNRELGSLRASAVGRSSVPFLELSPEQNHRRLMTDETGTRESFWFFTWGPTTDNVLAYLFGHEDRFMLTFEFWRADHHRPPDHGEIFISEIQQTEFIAVMQGAIDILSDPWSPARDGDST